MSKESVVAHLAKWGKSERDIIECEASTATVALAAAAIGVEPARIAKTLALYHGDGAILIVAAGDAKLDNQKFKAQFGHKAKMLTGEDTLRFTSHSPGGVCPFGIPQGVDVYLDDSLKRFESVFPACGTPTSSIELTLPEMEACSCSKGWIDVCKIVESA